MSRSDERNPWSIRLWWIRPIRGSVFNAMTEPRGIGEARTWRSISVHRWSRNWNDGMVIDRVPPFSCLIYNNFSSIIREKKSLLNDGSSNVGAKRRERENQRETVLRNAKSIVYMQYRNFDRFSFRFFDIAGIWKKKIPVIFSIDKILLNILYE